MNKKQTIAEKHGVDLNNFQIRNIIVKDVTAFNFCGGVFVLITSLVFLIGAMTNKNNTFALIFFSLLSVALLLLSIVHFLYMFLFKIKFQDGMICYQSVWKKLDFFVTDIQYFMVAPSTDGTPRRTEPALVMPTAQKPPASFPQPRMAPSLCTQPGHRAQE